ncbi:MAG: polyprenyl synthetase family protein [Ruminiclostridium sp.]|nr:polyprenyl synthetase family protein [Ruminiclostridium sp.]
MTDISVSIELLRKASLVLDDCIGHDPEDRGQPALHMRIGPECSALFAIKTAAFSMQRLKKRFTSGIILPQHYHLCLDALIETTYLMASGAFRELLGTVKKRGRRVVSDAPSAVIVSLGKKSLFPFLVS